MDNINWNEVQEESNERPTAGGYIAGIVNVEDVTDKKYLRISWDFAEGPFKGSNMEVNNRAGFWPMSFVKSYKPKALGFFKKFKTAVEGSNRGYQFRNDPQSLIGKYIGVVLSEEEYRAKDGTTKIRLYVSDVVSGADIRESRFHVEPLKKRSDEQAAIPSVPDFGAITGEDLNLPF